MPTSIPIPWSCRTLRRRTSPSRTSLIARTPIFMALPSLAPSSTLPPSPIPLFFLGLWWFHFWVLFWTRNWSLFWGAKREERRFLGLIWGKNTGWERETDCEERKNQLKKWEEREKSNKKIINHMPHFVRTMANLWLYCRMLQKIWHLEHLINGVKWCLVWDMCQIFSVGPKDLGPRPI